MRALFATVLGLIAVGVLLIAYGLLSPRAAAAPFGVQSGDARGDSYQVAGSVPLTATAGGDAKASEQQLQLDCEPGQRAVIRQVTGRAAAACLDATRPGEPYGVTPASLVYRVSDPELRARPYVPASPRRVRTALVRRSSGRDWRKTALVVGGSTAAGAGLGAIFGGKTGALIGAAIGGGASTLYEATKR